MDSNCIVRLRKPGLPGAVDSPGFQPRADGRMILRTPRAAPSPSARNRLPLGRVIVIFPGECLRTDRIYKIYRIGFIKILPILEILVNHQGRWSRYAPSGHSTTFADENQSCPSWKSWLIIKVGGLDTPLRGTRPPLQMRINPVHPVNPVKIIRLAKSVPRLSGRIDEGPPILSI
jgi:hypothetical protein